MLTSLLLLAAIWNQLDLHYENRLDRIARHERLVALLHANATWRLDETPFSRFPQRRTYANRKVADGAPSTGLASDCIELSASARRVIRTLFDEVVELDVGIVVDGTPGALDAGRNVVALATLDRIREFTFLRRLDLDPTRATICGVRIPTLENRETHFIEALGCLEELTLSWTHVNGDRLLQIAARLPRLRVIWVVGCPYVTGSQQRELIGRGLTVWGFR